MYTRRITSGAMPPEQKKTGCRHRGNYIGLRLPSIRAHAERAVMDNAAAYQVYEVHAQCCDIHYAFMCMYISTKGHFPSAVYVTGETTVTTFRPFCKYVRQSPRCIRVLQHEVETPQNKGRPGASTAGIIFASSSFYTCTCTACYDGQCGSFSSSLATCRML